MSKNAEFESTVTGLPRWLLREYLEELGGRAQADDRLDGDGWTARLTQVEDYRLGSLRVGRVHLEIQGTAEAVARVRAAIEKKLVRAGG